MLSTSPVVYRDPNRAAKYARNETIVVAVNFLCALLMLFISIYLPESN
jgi:hypothetical protein